ncbi:hypothetical protein GGI02_003213 [Coemansia sp. RSA 2322]|nr:hypothetical protein GGI02_003213 [Coemansia sp. RSA 2322]
MISVPELRAVVDDIKRVAASNSNISSDSEDEAGSSGTQNTFAGRAYDIDQLHAEDARDKVFVAILKALVARHNRPSSPKELATCIMKHEFTMLGGATPYATVSSRISQHFKRIFDHVPPRPPILGRVAHEKHTRKYFYYVASAAEQDAFHRKVRSGLIPAQPLACVSSSSARKPRCMVPAVAVEADQSPQAVRRSRRAVSADPADAARQAPLRSTSHTPAAARSSVKSVATEISTRSRHISYDGKSPTESEATLTRSRRTSYDSGSSARRSSDEEGSDGDGGNPYARKRYRSVRSAVAQAYPRRRLRQAFTAGAEGPLPPPAVAAGKWRRRPAAVMNQEAGGAGGGCGSTWLAAQPLDGMFGGSPGGGSSSKDGLAAAGDLLSPVVARPPDVDAPLRSDDGEEEELECNGANRLTTTTPAEASAGEQQSGDDICSMSSACSGATAVASTEIDFSFHELMDAELMSVNELEKLWATSNPGSGMVVVEQGDLFPVESSLALKEAAVVVAPAAEVAIAPKAVEAAAPSSDLAPSRLTQRLLALSALQPMGAQPAAVPRLVLDGSAGLFVDSVEPTAALVENTSDHEEAGGAAEAAEAAAVEAVEAEQNMEARGSRRVILPDPFADIAASAMVATKAAVAPRIVLTIVETVPVYMTVVTTTEPAVTGPTGGRWLVRRHRLLRLVENGYVNASSLLLAGGVASEQERSIVLSLEVGRFKWRRPQSKLYGTWIPLPRARALAATCSLNHRLGPFLNDNLEAYFPAPLPTAFVRHVITPFFAGAGAEFQHLADAASAAAPQSISRSSTFGATARGTPSPSIIQALSRAPPPAFSLAAAKAIPSLLHLLSADGPMLGAEKAGEEAMDDAGGDAETRNDTETRNDAETSSTHAQRLAAAIALSVDPPADADDDDDDESAHAFGGLGLSDADMICSSTPPSPPPPPAEEAPPGAPRPLAARRAGGLNARLAQTMEAFGLTGAAKAGLLLRLRAAAAASTTGRPQAVAPYLLYRNAASKRAAAARGGDDEGGGVRGKRARVARGTRSALSHSSSGPADAELPKNAASSSTARLADAAAILRVACAIYSQKVNSALMAPAAEEDRPPLPPLPPPSAPQSRPVRPPPPPSAPARASPRPMRPPAPRPAAAGPLQRPVRPMRPMRPPMQPNGGAAAPRRPPPRPHTATVANTRPGMVPRPGMVVSRPGTMMSRPGTMVSRPGTMMSRPGASPRPGTMPRPMTASPRPTTASPRPMVASSPRPSPATAKPFSPPASRQQTAPPRQQAPPSSSE